MPRMSHLPVIVMVSAALVCGVDALAQVIAVAGPVGTQPAAGQPRDLNAPLPTGTARIRGRVTARDTGRPVRRALVRLSAPGIRETRTTSTDQDGRYEFAELAAGSYTLTASRSGFVAGGYRQLRTTQPPRPVVLSDRESRDDIDISLMPGGVITGRVVDEFGEPITDAIVSAQRQQYTGGARRPVMAGPPSTSNDIGEFRVYGLAPGEYYLSVQPRAAMGGPFDTSNDRSGYGQTWYPSASDMTLAQRITVRPGDTVANIVVTMMPTRTARVSGTVFGADGRPARSGAVMVMPRDGVGMSNLTAMIRPDGTFSASGIAPGDYTFRANVGMPTSPGPILQPPTMAVADVSVNGVDVTDVVLQPQVPVTVTGRLVGDPTTLSRLDPSRVRLNLVPLAPVMFGGPATAPQPAAADFTFQATTFPGVVAVRQLAMPTGFIISAVRLDGREVTRSFEVSAGAPPGALEVEVTASTAKLAVTVANARSEPQTDRQVMVFPEDEATWGAQLPGHGASGRTNDEGRYETPVLLPGSYYVTLADDLQPGDNNDPEVLAALRSRAQRVIVHEGDTTAVGLQVSDR